MKLDQGGMWNQHFYTTNGQRNIMGLDGSVSSGKW
jgi:hypothetical protein